MALLAWRIAAARGDELTTLSLCHVADCVCAFPVAPLRDIDALASCDSADDQSYGARTDTRKLFGAPTSFRYWKLSAAFIDVFDDAELLVEDQDLGYTEYWMNEAGVSPPFLLSLPPVAHLSPSVLCLSYDQIAQFFNCFRLLFRSVDEMFPACGFLVSASFSSRAL